MFYIILHGGVVETGFIYIFSRTAARL